MIRFQWGKNSNWLRCVGPPVRTATDTSRQLGILSKFVGCRRDGVVSLSCLCSCLWTGPLKVTVTIFSCRPVVGSCLRRVVKCESALTGLQADIWTRGLRNKKPGVLFGGPLPAVKIVVINWTSVRVYCRHQRLYKRRAMILWITIHCSYLGLYLVPKRSWLNL
jgi:hypothetical protein